MTVGIAVAAANSRLNVLRGVTYTGIGSVFVKLHTGDPGAAGASNASAVTTRNAITWNAPSGGSMTLSTLSAWTMTATETISHTSLWDASTAGTFLGSFALTASKSVNNTDTLTINTFTLTESPIAA